MLGVLTGSNDPCGVFDPLSGSRSFSIHELEKWLRRWRLTQLVALVDQLDGEDFAFLEEGVKYNTQLAAAIMALRPFCRLSPSRNIWRSTR